jgi:hypothetical protein
MPPLHRPAQHVLLAIQLRSSRGLERKVSPSEKHVGQSKAASMPWRTSNCCLSCRLAIAAYHVVWLEE